MNRPDILTKLKKTLRREETVSSIMILVFLALAFSAMFVSPHLYRRSVQEGDIALKDVYAPYDFTYSWEIDEEKTKKAAEDAARSVSKVLSRDFSSEEKVRFDLDEFFRMLTNAEEAKVSIEDEVSSVKNATGGKVSDRSIRALLEYRDAKKLSVKIAGITDKVFLIGYASEDSLNYIKDASSAAIFNKETGNITERKPDGILKKSTLQAMLDDYALKQFGKDRKTRQAAVELISAYILPNLVPDEKMTEEVRQAKIKRLEPIYRTWEVKKNELIIEKGKRVDARHIAQVSQIRRFFRPGIRATFPFGIVLLFLLLGLVGGIYMSFIQKKSFLRNTKGIAIILLNMLFIIVAADFIISSPQPSYFIPMASIGMIITILVGFNAAFLSVVLASVLIAFLVGGKIEVFLVLLAGSSVGMLLIRDARRRTRILWAGLAVGLVKFAGIVCVGLINSLETNVYLRDGLWGIASGVLSSFIVMGLLPVFEYIFKVPTNISLLELSDLNHPLLKELALEAPGTYHHSIMVGNLAEAACDAIGANSLLARVGAYYHDIGKIPKAEYFGENEMGSGSKHENLAPSMSALIIAKHVKEGAEIAKKYKLNSTIVDFITQHHGDSLIAYFYQKALEKSKIEGSHPKERDFRYPGPKPQTKEGAIILLADAVEASSRTLDDPTPSSIKNLVRKIVNNKFIDGQLDSCDLTLRDMHKIADSFVRVLMGTFHTRMEYPESSRKLKDNEVSESSDEDKKRKPKPKKKS